MIFKNEQPTGELDGFLDNGSHLTGELRFQDTFRIDGKVAGKILSDGNLIVGEKGEIEAEVRVRSVCIAGLLRGTIRDAQRVEIASTGKVYGDINTQALVVEDGAVFEGCCSMEREAAKKSDREVAQLVPEPNLKVRRDAAERAKSS